MSPKKLTYEQKQERKRWREKINKLVRDEREAQQGRLAEREEQG